MTGGASRVVGWGPFRIPGEKRTWEAAMKTARQMLDAAEEASSRPGSGPGSTDAAQEGPHTLAEKTHGVEQPAPIDEPRRWTRIALHETAREVGDELLRRGPLQRAIALQARDLMTAGATCVGENETLVDAAQTMRDLDVGALAICGEDNRIIGMLTVRDIVVGCVAAGGDPATAVAGQFAQGKPITIGADDSVDEALKTMTDHQVRRLPVIDGHALVGMLSKADVTRELSERRAGDTASHDAPSGVARDHA
jgi:CBS domain-containing protein